ncbi:MAG: CDP-alcohol phosphatidyltransferase family protein [Muribaculaceae bacterium]|nr:CDP-alcohol phosphatidyltransferase family protein [Muribaculaceae bacterium]
MFDKIRAEYRASLKSADTEEHIDLAFYRPIGFAWACLFRSLHVTPNAVTIMSIFIGIAAGVCFYYTDMWVNVAGMLLLMWANSYDSADGQLARLTGQHSALGRILDGVAGDFWFASIYIAICLRTNMTVGFFAGHTWIIWTVAVLAGICHAKQAAVADCYRQFHLYAVKGRAGSELDSSVELKKKYDAMSWGKDFFRKLIQGVYYCYTLNQEKTTPAMQQLRLMLRSRYPDGVLPENVAAYLRKLSFPLCKWENFMTFNWRTIFLFASIFAGMPWLYFVAELTVFNAVLVYTICRHESLCRTMMHYLRTHP